LSAICIDVPMSSSATLAHWYSRFHYNISINIWVEFFHIDVPNIPMCCSQTNQIRTFMQWWSRADCSELIAGLKMCGMVVWAKSIHIKLCDVGSVASWGRTNIVSVTDKLEYEMKECSCGYIWYSSVNGEMGTQNWCQTSENMALGEINFT
jgi:hypothetical protein